MLPTYEDQSKVIINKVSSVQRFDVVVLNSLKNSKSKYIKRVVGVPGDNIKYSHNRLYINDKLIHENYLNNKEALKSKVTNNYANYTDLDLTKKTLIPKNKYIVLGDNRPYSNDSRFFGFVDSEQINGVVIVKKNPKGKWNFVK